MRLVVKQLTSKQATVAALTAELIKYLSNSNAFTRFFEDIIQIECLGARTLLPCRLFIAYLTRVFRCVTKSVVVISQGICRVFRNIITANTDHWTDTNQRSADDKPDAVF